MKKIIYILCALALIGIVVFRISTISAENSMQVFNTARTAVTDGIPVETIVAQTADGVLQNPIQIKDNRGYVSFARLGKFASGQTVGDGEIISVSKNIDLDTGMYIVRTRNVADGAYMAKSAMRGIYIPLYAIKNNTVMVADNGAAALREIKIINADNENAVVSGINDGDVIILSHVAAGEKVKVESRVPNTNTEVK